MSQWIADAASYLERIVAVGSPHTRIERYEFSGHRDDHGLNIDTGIAVAAPDTWEWPTVLNDGVGSLWVHRLTHHRFQVHYTGESVIKETCEENIRLYTASSEELDRLSV